MYIVVFHPLQTLVELLIKVFQVTQVAQSNVNKKKRRETEMTAGTNARGEKFDRILL